VKRERESTVRGGDESGDLKHGLGNLASVDILPL